MIEAADEILEDVGEGLKSVWDWLGDALGDVSQAVTNTIPNLSFASAIDPGFGSGGEQPYRWELGDIGLYALLEKHPFGISIMVYDKDSDNVEERVDGM